MGKLNSAVPDALIDALDDIASKTSRTRSSVAAHLLAMAVDQWFKDGEIKPETLLLMSEALKKFE